MLEDIILDENKNVDIPPEQSKRVAVTLGRWQPPTIGHYFLINKMVQDIRMHNSKHKDFRLETTPVVVIIHGEKTGKDTTKNPLSIEDRIKIIKASGKADRKTIFIKANSAFDAFVKVRKAGYEPILIYGGSDRDDKQNGAPYKQMLDKYFVSKDGKSIKHEFKAVPRASDLGVKAQEELLKMIEKDGKVSVNEVSGKLARRAVELNLPKAFAAIAGLENKPELAKLVFKKVLKGIKDER